MNTQKFLVSGIVGGIVSLLAGYLLFGMLLMDFAAKNAGSATGVMRADTEMIWWAMILGNIFYGLFYSYVYNRWANISSFGAGASAGFVIGLLSGAAMCLIMYSTSNLTNLTGTVVDILGRAVLGLLVGGTVGVMNGLGAKKTA
jgi:hypothetical protein